MGKRALISLAVVIFLSAARPPVAAPFENVFRPQIPPMVCMPVADVSDIYEVGESQAFFGLPGCYVVQKKDNLLDVARENGIGFNEIIAANPGMDHWDPKVGSEITLPTVWLIPAPLREGIVLNLAEMRLYYRYRLGGRRYVATYPLGIGREGYDTPLGSYAISEKQENPRWYPTPSIHAENPDLPEFVPPGPDNPLGAYKMRLSHTTYLIHGTNKPLGIGRRVSHGCIRLYPEDIQELYGMTPIGTPVEVVYMPVKAAVVNGRLYVEVHRDYLGGTDMLESAMDAIRDVGGLRLVDIGKLNEAIEAGSGMPVDVTLDEMPEEKKDK